MNIFEDDVWSMRARKRAVRRKRWRQATLVLAVLMVLGLMAWLAAIGSIWLAILFAMLFIGSASFLVYCLKRSVERGELQGRFGAIIFREKSPVTFWLGIGAYGTFAGFLFFSGLRLLGAAPNWFTALLQSMSSHH